MLIRVQGQGQRQLAEQSGSCRTPGDGYDGLDRLKVHKVNGTISAIVAHDQLGNISSKFDVGSYTRLSLPRRLGRSSPP